MRLPLFLVVLTLLMLAAGDGRAQPAPAASPSPPRFDATGCHLPHVPSYMTDRVRCGTVSVPRDYEHPAAGSFKLAVVVIQSTSQPRRADPVLYIAGGPGDPLISHTVAIALHEASALAPDRDLVLVDQRGTGISEPALCPGLARRQLAVFGEGLPEAAFASAWKATYVDCWRRLEQSGMSPAWFGTSVTAADMDAVRRALGIARWNLYGISYGTAVAMTLMQMYPATIRSAILDSVYPPDPLPLSEDASFSRALDQLFGACAAYASCHDAYPELARTFHETIEHLTAHALAVPAPPGLGSPAIMLRAAGFRMLLRRLLYRRDLMVVIPRVIRAAHDGRAQVLRGVLARLAEEYLGTSPAEDVAVECRDRMGRGKDGSVSGVTELGLQEFSPLSDCRSWASAGPPPTIPAGTTTPVLILQGSVDPRTPPEFGRLAAQASGASARLIEFRDIGHGVAPASACGRSITAAFVADPHAALDNACATSAPPMFFLPPEH